MRLATVVKVRAGVAWRAKARAELRKAEAKMREDIILSVDDNENKKKRKMFKVWSFIGFFFFFVEATSLYNLFLLLKFYR
jgi:hypothetical protein